MTLVVTHSTVTGAPADSTALVDGVAWDANHSLAGTASAAQLNENVVQSVTNDTNVTGSIASQALTLGWTGTLAPARGGTGVANNAASTTTITGAYSLAWTLSGTTALTLPTSGTLATLAGAESLSNKTFVAPALGTPASGVATNLTGTAAGLTAGNVTTNANLTGPITSSGNATSIASYTGTGTQFVMAAGTPVVANITVTSAAIFGTDGSSSTFGPGGTGAVNATFILNGSSGSGVGARFAFQKNSVSKWLFGDDASIQGSGTSTDLELYNVVTGATTVKYGSADDVVTFAGKVASKSATAGVGYSTGAGGAVTQATSKTTGVTLNTVCGQITMNNASTSGTTAFTLTNSTIAATDSVIVCIASAATANSYLVTVTAVAAGSCRIEVRCYNGPLSEAIVLNFAVIKGVAS